MTPTDAWEVIPDLRFIYDEPFVDSSQLPAHLVGRVAFAEVTVVHHEYCVCTTNLPLVIDPIARRWMKRTGTGVQLGVWLHKAG